MMIALLRMMSNAVGDVFPGENDENDDDFVVVVVAAAVAVSGVDRGDDRDQCYSCQGLQTCEFSSSSGSESHYRKWKLGEALIFWESLEVDFEFGSDFDLGFDHDGFFLVLRHW